MREPQKLAAVQFTAEMWLPGSSKTVNTAENGSQYGLTYYPDERLVRLHIKGPDKVRFVPLEQVKNLAFEDEAWLRPPAPVAAKK